MSAENKGVTTTPNDPPGRKRPYSTPRLTEYGSVAKLTQGTLTLQQDSPGGIGWKKASCL
ncbi:MAG TPA: lasso RiPP family leader peptide-containing protein [Vicinamibacterales bacterium]